MPKSVATAHIVAEIKKEYLQQHLDEVKGLITVWCKQLRSPGPVHPHNGELGWDSEYRPPLEVDPDSNAMLRGHVKSRALWRHHAEWKLQLRKAWELVSDLRMKGMKQIPLGTGTDSSLIMKNYFGTALYGAFEALRRNRSVKMNYLTVSDQPGLMCGEYTIDPTVATEVDREHVQKSHTSLAVSLKGKPKLKALVALCREINATEDHMVALANKTLKAQDIFHPCRFCRPLWR